MGRSVPETRGQGGPDAGPMAGPLAAFCGGAAEGWGRRTVPVSAGGSWAITRTSTSTSPLHLRAIAVERATIGNRSRELRRRFDRSCARRAAAFTATSLRRLLSLEVGFAAFACDPLGEGNHQRILAPVVGGQAVRKAVASLRPRRRRGPAPPSATAAALKAQSAASARSAPHAAA